MQTNFIALYLLFKWISIVCLLISYTPPRLAPIPLTLSPSWPRFAGQLNCSALIRTWTLSETGITDMKTDTCLSHKLFCSTWRLIYIIWFVVKEATFQKAMLEDPDSNSHFNQNVSIASDTLAKHFLEGPGPAKFRYFGHLPWGVNPDFTLPSTGL